MLCAVTARLDNFFNDRGEPVGCTLGYRTACFGPNQSTYAQRKLFSDCEQISQPGHPQHRMCSRRPR